jgi:Arginine deiminase
VAHTPTSGNNLVAVEPGVVFAYDRNTRTNSLLRKAGIEVITSGRRRMACPLIRDPVDFCEPRPGNTAACRILRPLRTGPYAGRGPVLRRVSAVLTGVRADDRCCLGHPLGLTFNEVFI